MMFVQKSRELLSIRLEERIRSFKRSAAMFVSEEKEKRKISKRKSNSVVLLAF